MEIYGKRVGEYLDIVKTPMVLLIALAIIQFVIRVVGYFLGINIVRLLGWFMVAASEVVSVLMLLYISWSAVKRRRWNALNTLIAGLLFGFIGGLILALDLTAGNLVAYILSAESWTAFKVAAYTGVGLVFIPLIQCVLGGFISGIVSLVLEK